MTRKLAIAALIAVTSSSSAYEGPVIGPMIRIDPVTESIQDRFALEYTAVARGLEVAIAWMERPQDFDENEHIHMQRRAYSADGGTTWILDNVHAPGTENNSGVPETDPFTAFDPRTGDIWVGAKQGGRALWLARWQEGAPQFDAAIRAYDNGGQGTVDKPWAAAGPKPGFPDSTRLYIAWAGRKFIWSDDQGQTWPTSPSDYGGFGYPLPRVGPTGELYIAEMENRFNVHRSNSLVNPTDPSSPPLFKTPVVFADPAPPDGNPWIPGDFHAHQLGFLAVDPLDGNKIYGVLHDKTSEDGNGNINIDLYFRKATDGMNDEDPPDIGLSPLMIVPAGVEVAGDQFFPWIETSVFQSETGPKTRIHILFMDTRHNAEQPDDGEDAFADVYYAFSDDEGDSWQEFRLTHQSFNIKDGTRDVDRPFFGDYIGMAVSGKRVYPAYAAIDGDPRAAEAFTNIIVFGDDTELEDVTAVEGTIVSGGIPELEESDDSRLTIRDNPSGGFNVPLLTKLVVGTTTISTSPDEIDLRIEAQTNRDSVSGSVSLKNWLTNQWSLVGEYTVSKNSDDNFWIRGIPDEQSGGLVPDFDYIRDSDGRIEIRLEQETVSGGTLLPLDSAYDMVQAVVVDN